MRCPRRAAERSDVVGDGGKKVCLADDAVLHRDVAFGLIKTGELNDAARTRIKREARAMGRLGDYPHIVNVFDFGDCHDQPGWGPPFRDKEAVKVQPLIAAPESKRIGC